MWEKEKEKEIRKGYKKIRLTRNKVIEITRRSVINLIPILCEEYSEHHNSPAALHVTRWSNIVFIHFYP